MAEPDRPCIVIDRTSGDEDQGQDAEAQLQDTVHRALKVGLVAVASRTDEDVSGDTPWSERPALSKSITQSYNEGIPIVTREPSRLWRGDPVTGLTLIEALPNLVVLDRPMWERLDGAWVDQTETAYLMRFVELWQAWAEKRRAQERTLHAVRAIKEGRRPTKTGRGLGRPAVTIEPHHLDVARRIMAQGHHRWNGLVEAHRRVLELRGYHEAKDPKTQKKRYVSKETLARALGLRTSAQNSTPPKSPTSPTDGPSAGNRPIVGDRTENESAPQVQRERKKHD